jgi:hypothetical protein
VTDYDGFVSSKVADDGLDSSYQVLQDRKSVV